MANTIVQRTLLGNSTSRKVVRMIHIISDGSEEAATVIFPNASFSAVASKGSLVRVVATGNSCTCRLSWKQTTNSPIASFDPISDIELDFANFGGITNPNGTGATGDIVLDTANLDAGDEVFILIEVAQ